MCASNVDAPQDTCTFGDDIVINQQIILDNLPQQEMTCENVFSYLLTQSIFSYAYCDTLNSENFGKICCKTCESKL